MPGVAKHSLDYFDCVPVIGPSTGSGGLGSGGKGGGGDPGGHCSKGTTSGHQWIHAP
ncbi:hypothetical protein Smic_78260 [Streptomyces microflavus]|uniref:Uncharacterized protein n=1 Tax=Streptomyces microflavus TaxID=1919 RepID=A0A7J0D3F8_STRMI|nr:hypothetical protein Smic_78260 [Streptomyces microflavus]